MMMLFNNILSPATVTRPLKYRSRTASCYVRQSRSFAKSIRKVVVS